MAKREFIDVDTIKDLLACDLYNAEMKLIKLHGLCNTQAVTEQDIVKPYLKKLSNEVKNHAVEFELFGISDDYISIGILQGIIIRLLSEQGDTECMMQMRQTVGYDIDKNELIKALQYDRNQYKKGYADCKEKIIALLREEIDRSTLKDIPSEDGCRLCELKSEYAIHVESVLNQVELLI